MSIIHLLILGSYAILALWVNMVRRMDKWFNVMSRRIDVYRGLEQGWNGYDAPPISQKVLCRTFDLIFDMRFNYHYCWFEEWEMAPTGRETVQLECSPDKKKQMYMEVEIYDDKYVIYCQDEDWEKTVKSHEEVLQIMKAWTPKSIFQTLRLRSLW